MCSADLCALGLPECARPRQPIARKGEAFRAHSLCKGNPAAGGCGSSVFGSQNCLLHCEAWGAGALCRRPRARTPGSGRAVDAPVRAPWRLQPLALSRLRYHSQLPGATVASPGRGLCPRVPRHSPGARRTSWRRMSGPVSTAAAAAAASWWTPSAGGRQSRGRPLFRERLCTPDLGRRPGPPPRRGSPSPKPRRRERGREVERGKAPVS